MTPGITLAAGLGACIRVFECLHVQPGLPALPLDSCLRQGLCENGVGGWANKGAGCGAGQRVELIRGWITCGVGGMPGQACKARHVTFLPHLSSTPPDMQMHSGGLHADCQS